MAKQKRNDTLRNAVSILLVEDYEVNRNVVLQYLHWAGYQVDVAENGRQAVQAFTQTPYDLILMDIEMPIMDGYAAIQLIRKIENDGQAASDSKDPVKSKRIPVIAMSGHDVEAETEKCLSLGFDACIRKPFRREQLKSVVQKWTAPEYNSRLGGNSPSVHEPSDQSTMETEAPLNLDRAIKEFMGKKELLLDVLDTFINTVSAQIRDIRQAVSVNEYRAIATQAHAIKGGAANLTASKLAGIAAELEKSALAKPSEDFDKLVENLEEEFHRLKIYLRQNSMQHNIEGNHENSDC